MPVRNASENGGSLTLIELSAARGPTASTAGVSVEARQAEQSEASYAGIAAICSSSTKTTHKRNQLVQRPE